MTREGEFARQFREIQPKFSRLYNRLLVQADLSFPQFALLSQLAASGIVSMTEASARLHITKPAVTHLVDRLEKNRFLKRLPHPEDRRVSLLEIQPKGKSIVRRIQGRVLGLVLRNLNRFGSEEKKIIVRFYALLSQTLDEFLGGSRKR